MPRITINHLLLIPLTGMFFLVNAQDKAAIEKKLIEQYTLTQPTADNTDIVIAGSVLVLQTSNLMMAPVTGTNFYQNTFKDGKITQNAAGKVTNALGRFSRLPGASAPSAPVTRTYVRGEKVWVTKIEVKDDGVTFDLFTDAVQDVRYKAALKFVFPKGISLTGDQVEKLVAEVFKVQPAEDTSANDQQQQQQQPQPGGQRQGPPAGRVAPATARGGCGGNSAGPIALPPPPRGRSARATSLLHRRRWTTRHQRRLSWVRRRTTSSTILANPLKVAKVGTKEIYFYKDIKVTFVAGKVSDVQ